MSSVIFKSQRNYKHSDPKIRLTAELLGHPPPRVVWLKDGQELTNDDRFIIQSSGHNHTLLANSVNQESWVQLNLNCSF